MGLSAGWSGSWEPVPLGLLISGIVPVGCYFKPVSSGGRPFHQAGTNALVATLAVLLILGLVNLAVRYPVDFTETQLFTLAPQSRQLCEICKSQLRWVFDRNQDPKTGNCWKITSGGSQFSFEYVDPRGLDWQRSLGSNNLEKYTQLDSSGGCFRW